MSTPIEQPFPQPTPVNPQSELLFLLGGMNAKLDGVITEQSAQRTEAAEFRTEVRTEVGELRTDLNVVVGDVNVLKSKQKVALPWPSIVAGVTGIIGGTVLVMTWLQPLFNAAP